MIDAIGQDDEAAWLLPIGRKQGSSTMSPPEMASALKAIRYRLDPVRQ
jgi:hypothetical protein